MIIAVDLDNTICDARWREHLIGEQGWAAYDDACTKDEPVLTMINLLQALGCIHDLIVLTERHERLRVPTNKLLAAWTVPIQEVLMRTEGNFMPAPELKMHLAAGGIHMMIDDSDAVLEAFRGRGVATMQFTMESRK